MKKIIGLILLTVISLTLTGCNNDEDDRPVVYVTIYPVGYLVERISGNEINVQRVPGSNAHSEAMDWSGPEIISMQQSEFIFYVGATLDTYIPNNASLLAEEGDVQLVNLGEYLNFAQVCYEHTHTHDDIQGEEPHMEECEETQESDDPHFWLDPNRMSIVAEVILNNLVTQFPQFENKFTENYVALQLELSALDHSYATMAEAAVKPVIATNMLFNYIHDAYELEIMILTTDAHNDNTIPSDILEFKDEALLHEIHYILFEKNANSPAGEQVLTALLSEDPTAQKLYLHGIGNLTQDELDNGETYLTLMYKNLAVLIEATK